MEFSQLLIFIGTHWYLWTIGVLVWIILLGIGTPGRNQGFLYQTITVGTFLCWIPLIVALVVPAMTLIEKTSGNLQF